jgi:aspartate racemase
MRAQPRSTAGIGYDRGHHGVKMREKIIGVLGGLGPAATIELYRQIIRRTRARKEQDHLRILIDNNPKVPDRIAAVFGTGPSCLPELVRSVRALERAGADFIVIPCVTVHYFHARLQRRTSLPVLHIIDETARRLRAEHPRARRIGLLATTAAIRSGLFQRSLADPDLELLVPDERSQKQLVTAAVHEIKAHGATTMARDLIRAAAEGLIACGARVIVAGCTEVPLVLQNGDVSVPIVDPIAILAEVAIARAGGTIVPGGRSSTSPRATRGRRRAGART